MCNEQRTVWYGAKSVFAHDDISARQGRPCFEERVVLLRARDEEDAIHLAEEEAEAYASASTRYLGYVNVFRISDPSISDRTEVFSIMRSMDLSDKDYLDRYYDDGSFRTR